MEGLLSTSYAPGSYVLREYAGRLCGLRAFSNNKTLEVVQCGKAQWTVDCSHLPKDASLKIIWESFAYSAGIHDAFIDSTRGFINPCAVFVYPSGYEGEASVRVNARDWSVQCALPTSEGAWKARSMDEFLDSPLSLTRSEGSCAHVWTVQAASTPHEIAVTGVPSLNTERVGDDLRRIFEAAIAFWDPTEKKPPFERYLLQLHLQAGLYGGLEHAAGAVLLEDPENLPAAGEAEPPEGYKEFLYLAAHEYFHAWLVKRLKPSGFLPYELSRETYTHDLWIFEGFTSFYEGLIPLRAGLITEEDYWEHVAKRFHYALGREGFDAMTLADSSMNAWTKLYRPTADSPYSQISYYTKGALAAFLINDELETQSCGKWSLERVLSTWFASVRNDIARSQWPGLEDLGFAEIVRKITGLDLSALIDELVCKELPRDAWLKRINSALERCGRRIVSDRKTRKAYCLSGLSPTKGKGTQVVLDYVPSSSPGFCAGLFAGDEIVAVDGERSERSSFNRQIERAQGRIVEVHAFRSGRLFSVKLDLSAPLKEAFEALLPFRIEQLSVKK